MNRWFLSLLAGFITAFTYPQVSTIRVASNLVLTPVLITDAGGRAIRDLKLEDFEVEESGIKVAAAQLGGPGEAPLELGILFDTSGSVYSRFEFERQAASRFLRRTMRTSDSVFIISIGNEPKVLQQRTSSLDTALQAVAAVSPTTQATAFYDSLAKGAHILRDVEHPEARRVIIALSDGEDNRSINNKLDDVSRELQVTNCLFH